MSLSRKHFVSSGAMALSAAGVVGLDLPAMAESRASIHFNVLKPSDYDRAAMIQKLTINTDHKQVFQSVNPLVIAPGIASLYLHMQNAMNAYEFSLGLGKLSTLGVLIGPSIVLALNDAMWKKYGIGKALGSGLASTNAYYKAGSNLDPNADANDPNGVYQDWSAQAVLARGGQLFVCHNATTAFAYMLGAKLRIGPQAALADFENNLLPGFQMVPAGVASVQQAQENGWKLYTII